jgi:ribonuclease P protein component
LLKQNIISTPFTLGKEERLKSRKMIEHLFAKGKSTSAFPLKLLYDTIEEEKPTLKAGVTASSRKFKKAVDRNRVKRVIKETYRLQKNSLHELLVTKGKSMTLFFIYIGKDLPLYKDVYDKMGVLLRRITNEIVNNKIID